MKYKYREDEQEKIDKIPDEMKDYVSLSIFDREKFDRIEIQSYEVTCVGEVKLPDEEKNVLTMHPKFSVIDTLKEGAMEFEQELAYAKLRMQIHKELDEKIENEEEEKTTEEEQDLNDNVQCSQEEIN